MDNLFIEGCRRGSLFLSLYHKKENEHTYNKLSETIHKEYISNYKFDFNAIEEKFNMKYDIEINLYLRDLFVSTLREVYYMNKLENYPAFFTDVIDVYLSGNVIIGWLGKFGSHNVQVKDIFPITPEDGVLNVW